MTDPETPPHTSFNLVDETWIAVRMLDGTVTHLSLRDCFVRANEIRELVGEVPTQVFAITRLLIAVLVRALQRAEPDARLGGARWQQLWEGGLPIAEIDDYLETMRDRFDLLHPERPFFQVADLSTAKGETKDSAQLIFDLPSNNRFFTTRAGEQTRQLSFAEAARWLVHIQAFDTSGIKSGALGDPRAKGGRGYPIGLAWSGLLGGVMVEGDSLRQTLLLNLVGHRPDQEDWPDDLPAWEREPDGAAERAHPHPSGPVDLATWQSRRVRLVSDGRMIVGSLVCNGDRLTPQNGYRDEMMSAWRHSEPQSKKAGHTVYMPREHQPSRALWRGISALLPRVEESRSGKDAARSLMPGVIEWVSFLQSRGYLPSDFFVSLRAIGVIYGSNNSVVDDIVDDRMLISIGLLNTVNAELAAGAERAVELADEGVRALRYLAENLARAAGGDQEGPGQRAGEAGYAALDAPYRRWLSMLTPETDLVQVVNDWRQQVRELLLGLGLELVAQAPPAAWSGREVTLRGKSELVNAPRAEGWFRRALHNALAVTNGKETAA